ncbi:MAG TPA: SUMF1/EgtB/PvdO family nonheme iron enzyme, partial [Polyangiaceae bacterium]
MAIRTRACSSHRFQSALIGLAATLSGVSACAKLVGIEETLVTRVDGAAGAGNSAGSAGSGTANAGTSNAGTANAGQSNGGSAPAGGAATAGAETSGAGKGGSGGGAGASECPCSAPKPTCENGKCVVRGPTMVKATSYYIDSTEVSKAQYDLFLAAKGSDTSGQIAECSWNNSYAPNGAVVDDPRPIVDVDWCDAAAYCSWADKRLCGAIGGGPVAPDDADDSTKAQMYLACAGAADERYPYGGFTLQPDYCNEYFSGYMADVGSFPKCEGHYDGIFDLVGNAAEWIDSCDT